MTGYFEATRISSWCLRRSLADAGPATHIRHLPMPRSITSYRFRPSSRMVSFPTTPISAAPYSTYVGTSDAFAKKNFNFSSSFTKISLRLVSSFISSHVMPASSSISIAFFARRPFASANVIYLIKRILLLMLLLQSNQKANVVCDHL